jgi:4-carboxymuconolactone decarboxylase
MAGPKRYRELKRNELSAEQQQVFDATAGPRGGFVPTPFHVLLESPQLASHMQALGAFCRYRTGLSPRFSEMVVLMVAAHFEAEYELYVHLPIAKKEGVPDNVIAAIRAKQVPKFDDAESKLIHDFVFTFFQLNDVPDQIFDQAVARFGRKRVVELAGILGYYSALAMLLRIFRVTP